MLGDKWNEPINSLNKTVEWCQHNKIKDILIQEKEVSMKEEKNIYWNIKKKVISLQQEKTDINITKNWNINTTRKKLFYK